MHAEQADEGLFDTETTRLYELLNSYHKAALADQPPSAVAHRIESAPHDPGTAIISGEGFLPSATVWLGGQFCDTTFVDDKTLRVRLRDGVSLSSSLAVSNAPAVTERRSCVIRGIHPDCGTPIPTVKDFALVVEFEASSEMSTARFVKIDARFPDGQRETATYRVPAEASKTGRLSIDGFRVERGGELRILAALYDDGGHADYVERLFSVIPSNPVQLWVYPRYGSTRHWTIGATDYQSSEDRYYCRGRFVFANGEDHDVTFGPRVRCRVSDAGLGELADFTFDVTPITVPAYRQRDLYYRTRHGSGSRVYEIFEHFDDARFEFWIESTEGELDDSIVFQAGAQVGVTANFVGNFSLADRLAIPAIIDTYSSEVYGTVGCIFTPDTPLLRIPGDHEDWEQFRDISVEEDSDDNCAKSDEAKDMCSSWSSPDEYDNRIDIFFIESFSGDPCASSIGGISPLEGPTYKWGKHSGCVIELISGIATSQSSAERMGFVIAHEVAHYLGVGCSSVPGNIMSSPLVGQLTYDQWTIMSEHGFVRRSNP